MFQEKELKMIVICPKCGVRLSKMHSASGMGLGFIFTKALEPYECKHCGIIRRSDFPADQRKKMLLRSIVMGVIGLIVIAAPIIILNMLIN